MALLSFLLLLAIPQIQLGFDIQPEPPHVHASLVSDVETIAPGQSATVGLFLEIEEGWHVYWLNPGDAGMPTRLEWSLPEGFSTGDLEWPYPEAVAEGPYVTYAYHDEATLLSTLNFPGFLEPGSHLTLDAHASWLVCNDICLPEEADLSISFEVSSNSEPNGEWANRFEEVRSRIPAESDVWTATASPHGEGFMLRLHPLEGAAIPDSIVFFAIDDSVIDHAAPQLVSRDGDDFVTSLAPSPYAQGSVERLRGVVVAETGLEHGGALPALLVDVPIQESMTALQGASGTESGSISLWLALVFAFVGGIILNLMPCVFPVLSIKILSFVQMANENRSVVRKHGWLFGLGVVLSFLVLAGILLLLRAGGEQLGWGFQLQTPGFVALMIFLLFILGLSLAGVFEIGASLIRVAGQTGQSSGYGASFASGVLATIVATPCTAPFMGSALGFALTQPALHSLLVFLALGVGMALPYVVLSMIPALLNLLPRPGAWMETFKQLMAFPLFATVVWLVWVFGQQTGNDGVAYLLLAMTIVALGVWIIGRWPAVQLAMRGRVISRLVVAVCFAAAAWLTFSATGFEGVGVGSVRQGDIAWDVYSDEAVRQGLESGRPVFVDFTAAWCLSCKVNERVAFGNSDVQQRFQELDVVMLKADWTTRDPNITEALASFGRSGVPLYVLYSTDPATEVDVLPEVITPGIILDALNRLPEASSGQSAAQM